MKLTGGVTMKPDTEPSKPFSTDDDHEETECGPGCDDYNGAEGRDCTGCTEPMSKVIQNVPSSER
jgi:hypothetical protein